MVRLPSHNIGKNCRTSFDKYILLRQKSGTNPDRTRFFLWQAGKDLVPTAGILSQAVKKNSMRHIDLSSHLLFKCITKAAFDYRKFEITWPILRH